MKPESKQYQVRTGNNPITIETGKLAGQAGGAVTLRLGDTVIFAAATMSPQAREDIDYFPLTVDYEERMYAGIYNSLFHADGQFFGSGGE